MNGPRNSAHALAKEEEPDKRYDSAWKLSFEEIETWLKKHRAPKGMTLIHSQELAELRDELRLLRLAPGVDRSSFERRYAQAHLLAENDRLKAEIVRLRGKLERPSSIVPGSPNTTEKESGS